MKTALLSGTSFTNPTHHYLHIVSIAFNLDPPHLVKISSELDLTYKALLIFFVNQNNDNTHKPQGHKVKIL